MKIIDKLPRATIALFPSADALNAHIASEPLVRFVCTVPGIRTMPGEVRALLATYSSEENKRQAEADAAIVDMQNRSTYLKHYAQRAKL
jgi:hypothetical protein